LEEDHQVEHNNNTAVTPYAPAEPALAQILSEAGQLYGQGVGAAGYVAPTQQTLQGLAGQEALGTAAQQQLAATLGGQYLKSFLISINYKKQVQILQQEFNHNLLVQVEHQQVLWHNNKHYHKLLKLLYL
jgi:hypothetical protein